MARFDRSRAPRRDVAGLLHAGAPIDEHRLRALLAGKVDRFDLYLAIEAAVAQSP